MNNDLRAISRALQSEYRRIAERGFDAEAYIKDFPDVFLTGMAPIEHYVKIGQHLGRELPISPSVQRKKSLNGEVIKVTVLCITYNQRMYIRETLEGFIRQKVDFPVEFIIGDDSSTDGTSEIIREYASKDSRIIPIIRETNLGVAANFLDLMSRVRGEYVALCEGDDYWTDDSKLQLQADFLNENLDYSIIFHPVKVIFEDSRQQPFEFPGELSNELKPWDLLLGNFIQTNSVMYRWRFRHRPPSWFAIDVKPLDWYLHLIHAEIGKIKFIDKVMAVYRKHSAGMWSSSHDLTAHRRKHGSGELKLYKEVHNLFGGLLNDVISVTYRSLFDFIVEDAVFNERYLQLGEIIADNEDLARASLPLHQTDFHVIRSSPLESEAALRRSIKVSVIVTTFNHAPHISQCLSSILEQRGPFTLEIVVGDDSSTDGTREIVESYRNEFPDIIKLIESSPNVGMLANIKRCIEKCTGDYVAFCEGDDYWLSSRKILKHLIFMLKRPDLVMTFNWLLLRLENKDSYIPHEAQGLLSNEVRSHEIARDPITANFSCCFYKKDAFGNVPDSYFLTPSAADWLFNVYVSQAGRIGFIREMLSVYRLHETGQWTGLPEVLQNSIFQEMRDFCRRTIGPARGFDETEIGFEVLQDNNKLLSQDFYLSMDLNFDNNCLLERGKIPLRGWIVSKWGKYVEIAVLYNDSLTRYKLLENRLDVSSVISKRERSFCSPICGFDIDLDFTGHDQRYHIFVSYDDHLIPWMSINAKIVSAAKSLDYASHDFA